MLGCHTFCRQFSRSPLNWLHSQLSSKEMTRGMSLRKTAAAPKLCRAVARGQSHVASGAVKPSPLGADKILVTDKAAADMFTGSAHPAFQALRHQRSGCRWRSLRPASQQQLAASKAPQPRPVASPVCRCAFELKFFFAPT